MDYEHEIHQRLSRFPVLNGRGNVRDSTQLLYEVIQLMLEQRTAAPPPCPTFDASLAGLEELGFSIPLAMQDDATVIGEHIEVSSEVLHPEPAPMPPRKMNAPHGLTKFGNPRRIRPPRKKK